MSIGSGDPDVDRLLTLRNTLAQSPAGLTAEEWLREGIERGYCSTPGCATHGTIPTHPSEDAAVEEGWDPCCFVVRLGSPADWVVEP